MLGLLGFVIFKYVLGVLLGLINLLLGIVLLKVVKFW